MLEIYFDEEQERQARIEEEKKKDESTWPFFGWWTDAEKELPKRSGDYLVKYQSGLYAIIYFGAGDRKHWGRSQVMHKVIAWAEIPKCKLA